MVLQILGVVVPLLVALLPLFKWPTLERRTRGHLAMLKEVPEGLGKEFRESVEEELRELAHRNEQALGRRATFIATVARVGAIAFLFLLSSLASRRAGESGSEMQDVFRMTGFFILFLLAIGFLVVLWKFTGAFGWIQMKDRRERLFRRAKAQGKHLYLVDGQEYIAIDKDELDQLVEANGGHWRRRPGPVIEGPAPEPSRPPQPEPAAPAAPAPETSPPSVERRNGSAAQCQSTGTGVQGT